MADEDKARRGVNQVRLPVIGLINAAARELEPPPPRTDARVRSSLADATAVEQRIRAKLIDVATDGKSGSSLRKDIRGLTAQLQALIEEAEFEVSALKLDRLKSRIHREAGHAEFRMK